MNKLLIFLIFIITSTSYASAYYIKLEDGIMLIDTGSEHDDLFEAIEFNKNSITFKDDVQLTFASHKEINDKSNDFLEKKLFSFLHSNVKSKLLIYSEESEEGATSIQDDFDSLPHSTSGRDSLRGTTFINPIHSATPYYLPTLHPATLLAFKENNQLTNQRSVAKRKLNRHSRPHLHHPPPQTKCLFLCNETFQNGTGGDHYRKYHADDYQKLTQKCAEGFVCHLCDDNKKITSVKLLGLHIRFKHKGTGYGSFLP